MPLNESYNLRQSVILHAMFVFVITHNSSNNNDRLNVQELDNVNTKVNSLYQ